MSTTEIPLYGIAGIRYIYETGEGAEILRAYILAYVIQEDTESERPTE